MTTQIIEKKINPPRRPGEINSADFAHWLPLAQNHFAEIEKKVQAGEMAPLNHMCLPYQDYLTMGQWMKDILRYIRQAEVYMDSVEEQAGEVK